VAVDVLDQLEIRNPDEFIQQCIGQLHPLRSRHRSHRFMVECL
jgi:hypothetical protein